jgi:hypothetical protein
MAAIGISRRGVGSVPMRPPFKFPHMSWPHPSSIYFLFVPLHTFPSTSSGPYLCYITIKQLGKEGAIESAVSSDVGGGVEVRRGVVCGEAELVSYGVITGGAELMRWAWPTLLDQRFSLWHQQETVPAVSGSDGSPKIIIGNPRYKEDLLEKHPVDLVVGHVSRVDPLGSDKIDRLLSLRVEGRVVVYGFGVCFVCFQYALSVQRWIHYR